MVVQHCFSQEIQQCLQRGATIDPSQNTNMPCNIGPYFAVHLQLLALDQHSLNIMSEIRVCTNISNELLICLLHSIRLAWV